MAESDEKSGRAAMPINKTSSLASRLLIHLSLQLFRSLWNINEFLNDILLGKETVMHARNMRFQVVG